MISLFLLTLWCSLSRATTVCYDKYGCFSDHPPFDNYLMALPSHPHSIGTRFILHTRANALKTPEILSTDNSSISNSSFNPSRKVAFIIHGFTQSGQDGWVKEMTSELLKKDTMNVIVVDWGQGSSMLIPYETVAGNSRLVSVQVTHFIDVLHRNFNVHLKKFHIIGHSLGAQVAGFVGEKLRKGGKLIGRITGMDPAGPAFEHDDPAARLDPTDAMLVDVIHTDARDGGPLDNSLGLRRPCGHVDFYPNGGKHQPGCETSSILENAVQSYLKGGKLSIHWLFGCDHMKSVAHFTASINSPCAMTAFPCGSWQDFLEGKCLSCEGACPQMGYNADQFRVTKRSKLFLITGGQHPYCVADNYFGITLLSDDRTKQSVIFNMFSNEVKIKLTGRNGEVETDRERSVKTGNTSFALSSARNIGELQSITVQFTGSGFHLNEIIVYSMAEDKRYKASFNENLCSYIPYFTYSSYTRKLHEGEASHNS